MKTSMSTGHLIARFGVMKTFEMVRDAGMDCVDLNIDTCLETQWSDRRNGVPSAFFYDPAKVQNYIDEVNAAVKATGVTVGQIHTPFPNWFRGYEAANKNAIFYTQVALDICHAVGCHTAVVHPLFESNMRGTPSTREEEWEVNIAFYTQLIPKLKEYDIVCCLENMWYSDGHYKKIYWGVCSDMNDSNRYIEELNKIAGGTYFGFCLDIGHLALLGLDCRDAINVLGKNLVALHVHDNDGISDQHVIPYHGIVLWERFLQGLTDIGYTGNMNFETDSTPREVPDDFVPQTIRMIGMVGDYFRTRLGQSRD